MSFDPYKIIINPVSSEAAFNLMEEKNTLVFIVDRRANKVSIKKAVETLFNVKVIKVKSTWIGPIESNPRGNKTYKVILDPDDD